LLGSISPSADFSADFGKMPEIPRDSPYSSNPPVTVRDRSRRIDAAQMSPKMVVTRG
jgi:hypothetical protein